ncbi:alanyl-tRNA editing protein, partial [Klebsiella pneumoniae]|nr:alanyl-tRNA editing protein [Klebsiella pneumoniae]
MATDKIFWKDSYLTRLDTTVAAVDGDDIRLDATIFFAFSGGQESDAGTIGGCPVLAASKAGLDI